MLHFLSNFIISQIWVTVTYTSIRIIRVQLDYKELQIILVCVQINHGVSKSLDLTGSRSLLGVQIQS